MGWKEMQKLLLPRDDGDGKSQQPLVRSIGVANFTVAQLSQLEPPPSVNQVEIHPYLRQHELTEYCRASGIRLMAYSPFGAATVGPKGTTLLDDPVVCSVAQANACTSAAALIRWSIQQGFTCIPKSTNPARIESNLAAAKSDKHISEDDVERLNGLDMEHRFTRGFVEGQWFEEGELQTASNGDAPNVKL